MKAFQFPLERVLQWRQTQFELEQAAMQRLMQQLTDLKHALMALAAARADAEHSLIHANGIDSRGMQTMGAYQARAAREKAAIIVRKQILEKDISIQMARNVEAQRRVKLLERLRAQRMSEWTSQMNAEQETFAAEAPGWAVGPHGRAKSASLLC